MKAAEIIAALPALSKRDLLAVRGAADALLGPQAAANNGATPPLFDAVTRALGLRIGFGTFQATATYKQFKRGEAAVSAFMTAELPEIKDAVTKQALCALIVSCLLDDLKGRHVPLSMGSVSSNLERAPQVFRDAFPGYLEGGAGRLIIDRLQRGTG
jgi:hypothetical protein